jgi:glycosyltransferase involved in cell wall biosynthesis
LVVTSHGGDLAMPRPTGVRRALVSAILRRAAAVIAVSGHVKQLVEELGVPGARIDVIDMGCDTGVFTWTDPADKARRKTELGIDPKRPVVIGVGELVRTKGWDVFLHALSLDPRANELQVVIAGDGAEGDSMHALAHQLRVDQVRWLGSIPQDRLARFYGASDICVFPTRIEALGLVALEAMACGAVVIASDVGGLPEIVRDGETGVLVPVDRPEAITTAIWRLLGDPELRLRLLHAGRACAAEHSLDRQVARVVNVYRRVLEGPTTQPSDS